jgi:hypothetical protein
MNARRHFLIIVTCISFSDSSKVCGVTTEPAPHPSETGPRMPTTLIIKARKWAR